MKFLIVSIFAFLILLIATSAGANHSTMRQICHRTHSSTNPFMVMHVGSASLNFHITHHNDFLYNGPGNTLLTVQKAWCKTHDPTNVPPAQPPVQVPDPHAHQDGIDDAPDPTKPQLG